MKRVLMPLPSYGFDPTETAVPWRALTAAGIEVVFATPEGAKAEADRRMVTGSGLPFYARRSLMAERPALEAYGEMAASPAFGAPLAYEQVRPEAFSALVLAGGHDKGMRPYLESPTLQRAVAWFFDHERPVGAICHGTLLAARSRSASTGRSVLHGRKTTGLTRNQELVAWQLTRLTLGDYYRTYPTLMADELVSFLASPADYFAGPGFPVPLWRDSASNLSPGFTVRDRNYLSARWPGDAHRFASELVALVVSTAR